MSSLKCTVLITVHNGTEPVFFDEALQSIFKQTVKADEILIVVDGSINSSLDEVIKKYQKQHKNITVKYLEKNIGPGMARNAGLKECKNELVAVMDSDDLMDNKRLELELKEFEKDSELVLVGGQLAEFVDNDLQKIVFRRIVPLTFNEIKSTARYRSPFNNVTVMFKKSVILKYGGYMKIRRGEDYCLFGKLIQENVKLKNIKETLAYFRLDQDALKRRKTWDHTKSIIKVRNEIRKLGLCNWFDVACFAMAQLILFISPLWLVKFVYRKTRNEEQ